MNPPAFVIAGQPQTLKCKRYARNRNTSVFQQLMDCELRDFLEFASAGVGIREQPFVSESSKSTQDVDILGLDFRLCLVTGGLGIGRRGYAARAGF